MRYIGSFRYYLGSIYGLYQMKTYNITMSYKELDDNNEYDLNINSEIPLEWNCISGEFIMLWACNVTHPSYDVFISPDIKFDDGFHHIVLIRNNITRWELLWILLELDKGNIMKHPKVICIKTNEYIINVDSNDEGIITIDGENIGYENIHVKVNNKHMKIVA